MGSTPIFGTTQSWACGPAFSIRPGSETPMSQISQPPTPDTPAPGRWKRPLRLTNVQVILLALVVIGGRLVIDFSQRIVEGQQKVEEQEQLEAEIESLLQEQEDLEAAKVYFSSPAFVEDWAHNEGKMVREGETLVVPLYRQSDEVQAAIPQPTEPSIEEMPSWQVWWALFFEREPLVNQ
jgi:cell division protein FtsB